MKYLKCKNNSFNYFAVVKQYQYCKDSKLLSGSGKPEKFSKY